MQVTALRNVTDAAHTPSVEIGRVILRSQSLEVSFLGMIVSVEQSDQIRAIAEMVAVLG